RLQAAVEGLSLRFVEIVYGSPHGGELLDERNRLCGDLAADMDRRFRAALARTFRIAAGAGDIDPAASDLAPTDPPELFAPPRPGLKGPGVTTQVFRKRVRALTTLFVAGLRTPPQPAKKRAGGRR